MNTTSNSPLTIVLNIIIHIRVHVPHILTTATFQGQPLFTQSFRFCSYYLRVATIQGRQLFKVAPNQPTSRRTFLGGERPS